jgi:hypothetical protein
LVDVEVLLLPLPPGMSGDFGGRIRCLARAGPVAPETCAVCVTGCMEVALTAAFAGPGSAVSESAVSESAVRAPIIPKRELRSA